MPSEKYLPPSGKLFIFKWLESERLICVFELAFWPRSASLDFVSLHVFFFFLQQFCFIFCSLIIVHTSTVEILSSCVLCTLMKSLWIMLWWWNIGLIWAKLQSVGRRRAAEITLNTYWYKHAQYVSSTYLVWYKLISIWYVPVNTYLKYKKY